MCLIRDDEFLATIQVAITFAGFFECVCYKFLTNPTIIRNIPELNISISHCDGCLHLPHFSFGELYLMVVTSGRTNYIQWDDLFVKDWQKPSV